MKKLFIVFCFIFPIYNLLASNDLATGTIDANLKHKLTIKTGTDLDFGDIAYSNSNGSVSIASDGTVGSPTNLTLPTSTRTAGSFVVFGPANQTVTVTLPTSDLTLANGVYISDFNSSDLSNGSLNLGTNGNAGVHVGGTLNVDGSAVSTGSLTGTYTVSVSY